MRVRAAIALLSVVVTVSEVLGASNTPIVDSVLRTRNEIVTGDIELVFLRKVGADNVFDADLSISFDFRKARRLRFDISRMPQGLSLRRGDEQLPLQIKGNGGRSILRMIMDQDRFIQYSPDRFVDQEAAVALVMSDKVSPYYSKMAFDPRVIGFTNESFEHFYSVDISSVISRFEGVDVSIEDSTLAGEQVTKLSHRRPAGQLITLWIAEARGPSIVKMETQASTEDGLMVTTMECTVREWKSGIWFPERVITSRTIEGKAISDGKPIPTEWVVVTKAILNEPIDEARFSLSGLEIAVGTPIAIEGAVEGPVDIWNGQTVVPASDSARNRQSRSDSSVSRTASLLAMNLAGIVALFVGFVIWRRLARRVR
jgi:hypothetical protein